MARPESINADRGFVLVVDDDERVGRGIVRLLFAAGYRAEAVRSGPATLAAVRQRKVDFIVLDLHMNGMSGLDVLVAMRAEFNRPPPIVLFSAHADEPIREAAVRLGAVGLIAKTKPEALLSLIGQYAT
jgi:CheY-like chemotaxis protein